MRWATKPGQESVLAIDITRDGFEWALTNSCLSHFEIGTYPSQAAWAERMAISPVRIQWDPERDELHRSLKHRSIQIGVTQPRISDLTRGKVDLFSIDTLVNMLTAAGLQLDLHIRRSHLISRLRPMRVRSLRVNMANRSTAASCSSCGIR